MSLIKWSEKFLQAQAPAVDVYDKKDAVIIETALPGVDPKNVQVSIEGNVLTIRGSSERKTEVDEKDYYRKEIRSGSFMRKITLPVGINAERMNTDCSDGILTISIPKLS